MKKKESGSIFAFKIITIIAGLLVFQPIFRQDYFKIFLIALVYFGAVLVLFLVNRFLKHRAFLTKKDLDTIRKLTPSKFEEFTGQLFRELGYSAEVTGGRGDGGIDIILKKDGKKTYAQCKKYGYKRKVKPGEVRDFYGGIADHIAKGEKSFFVTTSSFTQAAKNACRERNIEAIDGHKLLKYMKKVNVDVSGRSIVCPECDAELIEKDGPYGKFLGCKNYPKCRHTEKIVEK